MLSQSEIIAQAPLIKEYFSQFGELPNDEWTCLLGRLSIKNFNAGAFFQRVDEDPVSIGLVLNGLFRVYYQSFEGKEFTRAFADEKKPIGDYASYLARTPANVNIVALEPSTVAVMPLSQYFELFDRHSCWDRIGRRVVEKFYVEREQREAELAMLKVKVRYQRFLEKHPNLSTRVANVYIANYLGMTPETLSRLKNQNQG